MQSGGSSGRPIWAYGLIGCGGLSVLSLAGMCLAFTVMTGGAEGGTRYANNMEGYALDYIREHDILEPGETIAAYYDATLSLDGTEATIVTDRRVISHFQGRNTSIALTAIERIEHSDGGAAGDLIDVYGTGGEHLRIEIAPFNDGTGFLAELERQRARATGTL